MTSGEKFMFLDYLGYFPNNKTDQHGHRRDNKAPRKFSGF